MCLKTLCLVGIISQTDKHILFTEFFGLIALTAARHDAIQQWHHNQGNQSRYQQTTNNYHAQDRKSTRLNSSHVRISYAVFCLKKKKKKKKKHKKTNKKKNIQINLQNGSIIDTVTYKLTIVFCSNLHRAYA